MPTSTVENYVKTLYAAQQQSTQRLVAMGAIARAMDVTPGTATTMIRALAESGLVEYEPRTGTRLTDAGERLALHVLRRHRLIEVFLVEVLKLDWSEVHEEAEVLEHAVSDKVLDAMDRLLGRPDADPHGSPIPSATGDLPAVSDRSLVSCEVGEAFAVTRVIDHSAAFLQFIDQQGLRPGAAGTVLGSDDQADAVIVRLHEQPDDQSITLGGKAASKLMVQPHPPRQR